MLLSDIMAAALVGVRPVTRDTADLFSIYVHCSTLFRPCIKNHHYYVKSRSGSISYLRIAMTVMATLRELMPTISQLPCDNLESDKKPYYTKTS